MQSIQHHKHAISQEVFNNYVNHFFNYFWAFNNVNVIINKNIHWWYIYVNIEFLLRSILIYKKTKIDIKDYNGYIPGYGKSYVIVTEDVKKLYKEIVNIINFHYGKEFFSIKISELNTNHLVLNIKYKK